jgi:hypothetical protein
MFETKVQLFQLKIKLEFGLLNVKFSIDKLFIYDIISLRKTLKRKSKK